MNRIKFGQFCEFCPISMQARRLPLQRQLTDCFFSCLILSRSSAARS